jgi:acetylglutamate/LysW-gamma-L-alpha-aminoadipate kinase
MGSWNTSNVISMVTIVKIGGSLHSKGLTKNLFEDIKKFSKTESLVVVHGGGNTVTEIAEKLGKKQEFIVSPSGVKSRYTDKETASIFMMVMCGKINKEIVVSLQSLGVNAVGLGGIDGNILSAIRKKRLLIIDERKRKRAIEGGFTGKIKNVNTELINDLIKSGYLPVISPVALGDEFEILNVNGDRAASNIAAHLNADRVIFLTDVDGISLNDKLVTNLTLAESKEILPNLGFGMEQKLISCIESLDHGVKEGIIASGLVDDPISNAVKHSNCTVINNE